MSEYKVEDKFHSSARKKGAYRQEKRVSKSTWKKFKDDRDHSHLDAGMRVKRKVNG